MEPVVLVCENPLCGKTFVVTRRYAQPKRYCTPECSARHRSAVQYAANTEKANAQSRAWHAAHREEMNERRRQRRLEHLEEERANVRRWHAANPDRVKASRQAWYEKNGEATKAKMRARYRSLVEADPEKVRRESRERHQTLRRNSPWFRMVRGARQRAARKGLEFAINVDWVRKRWTGKCELSGIEFKAEPPGTPGQRMFAPSIDRIDSSKGYVPDNCRIILWALNAAKSDGTDDKLMSILRALISK
jgi:hypothetical protein